MKIIITESQIKAVLGDMELGEEYPVSWNIEEFKKLYSFSKRIKYCEQHLVRISSGSSRVVYKIDDEKVLKLAKNKKGIAQNEVEIMYGNSYDISDVIAKVYEYDENNLWVEMELARKVTPKIFNDVVGVTFDDYCNALRYQHGLAIKNNNRISKPDNMEVMWENDFVNSMLQFMTNYDLPVGDLCRLTSYGLVKREGQDSIVMIDYGLTEDVYKTYYKKK